MSVENPGINQCKREIPIVVSLTSDYEKFKDIPFTLNSLLNQELKPDRIILWLDKEKYNLIDLPYDITKYIKNGLEIRFVRDLGVYTKFIYAFKEFSESIIVTAEADIYYPADWLKKLYLSYISNQQDIHVHQACKVNLNLPCDKWEKNINDESAGFDNIMVIKGGVLFPPLCYSKEILREDIFLKEAKESDNIWLWIMALVNGKKIRLVKNHIKNFYYIDIVKNIFNLKKKKTNMDTELNNLMKYYKQNIVNKLH